MLLVRKNCYFLYGDSEIYSEMQAPSSGEDSYGLKKGLTHRSFVGAIMCAVVLVQINLDHLGIFTANRSLARLNVLFFFFGCIIAQQLAQQE